ncbi:MAG: hypothetical protein S4CHLAM123_09070 [Chlamydiales bacterium]|nr:hypothetical protein [Chlamydiales bacterium]
MVNYFNPYSDQSFFGFFRVFFSRIWAFISGDLPFEALASDEVQILILACVSISGALVGTFLVLRRQTMLANALSHTILLGIVIAFLVCHSLSLPVLMVAALITGVVTTFLTEFLTRVIKLQEDASVGLVFSIFFALGVVLLSLFGRNMHLGTELVMGNIDALQRGDIKVVGAILGINITLFVLLYHGFKITTFDQNLAKAFGFSPLFFNYLLMVQTSATSIGAFRAVGVLMILAFLVLPTLTARRITNRLVPLIWVAVGLGVLASVLGVGLSRHLLTMTGIGFSTSGIVVMVLGFFYVLIVALDALVDISPLSRYPSTSNIPSDLHEKNCTTR